MKSLPRVRLAWYSGLFAMLMVFLAACAPDAKSEIISPDPGPKLVAAHQSMAVEAVVEEAVVLPLLSDLTEEQIVAGLDADFAAALAQADPSNGETLALVNGCIGCHSLDPEAQMTGPTWHNVGDTAVSRVEGESPAEYLYLSITAPNDYLVSGYPGGVMPQTYAESIATDDLADLVAYLLAQQGAGAE